MKLFPALISICFLLSNDNAWIGKSAPELTSGNWINSKPHAIHDQKGKVVLLQFWTFACYNCQNTLPYISSYQAKYDREKFIVIGIHTPEFDFEKNEDLVKSNIKSLGISYPIVMDNDYKIWRTYKQEYWPCLYLIDKRGIIRYVHIGEGAYQEIEAMIQKLIYEN